MNRLMIAVAMATSAVPPAIAQDPPAESNVTTADPETLKLVTDCDARKFETVVEREVNGEKTSSKVKLCGKPGQTDAEWLITLKDAAAKIEGNPRMSQSAKDQLANAIKAEIAKVEATIAHPPVVAAEPPAQDPIPPAARVVEASPGISSVSKKPQLVIRCLVQGENGAGSSCSRLERDTRLSILAADELTGSTTLRFLRRGDERARLALAPMRRGETFRSKLPAELCVGVSSSKVSIQVMDSGQVVDTLGPYSLDC